MQRYFSDKKNDDYFELCNDDMRHIKTVMRMTDGDNIEVVYNQNVYLCCIESVNNNFRIRALKEQKITKKFTPKINLIIPFLKEFKLDLILQKSTEMGVDKITLIPMERSIIKVDDTKLGKKIDRWTRIMKEASEQSMRTTIPELEVLKSMSEITKMDGLKLVCSTNEIENNIKKVFAKYKTCDKMNIVVGPEGGISPKEEDYLTDNGFIKVTLGNQIMRVETVPLFLMSVINYEFME